MAKARVSLAYAPALLAVLFWSTSPTAFKIALRHQDPFSLLLGASLASTGALAIMLLVSGRWRELRSFKAADLSLSLLLGALNPLAYYLVLFRAYELLPAHVAQPLNMIWPIVLVLISMPLLGQRVGWLSLLAMAISFGGVVLVSLQGGALGKEPGNRLGIFLALSTSLIWAFYWVLNAKNKQNPVARLFLNFCFSSILLVLLALILREDLPAGIPAWTSAAYVGLFEMGITFVLWMTAMKWAGRSDGIGNLVYLAPFLNLMLAWKILDEHIYLTSIFGILLLVTGILLQNLKGRHEGR